MADKIKRVGGLVNRGLEGLLERAERRDVKGSIKDAVRETTGDVQQLRRDAIAASADLKGKERRNAEIESELERLFNLSDVAIDRGDVRKQREIADLVEHLTDEYKQIQDELDEYHAMAQDARNELEEQADAARRFQMEAAKTLRDHERNKREEKRLNRQLGTGTTTDVTGRNLARALDEYNTTKNNRDALREARKDPAFQRDNPLTLDSSTGSAIRRIERQLGSSADDPSARMAKAASRILEARGGRSEARELDASDDESEAPAAPGKEADTRADAAPETPAAPDAGKQAKDKPATKRGAAEREGM